MIRADRLSYGDYVSLKSTGEHVQVRSITKHKIGYLRSSSSKNLSYVRLMEIEPIELTLDVQRTYGLGTTSEDKYAILTNVQKRQPCELLTHTERGDGVTLQVKYLHDLQHYFRLLGIQKEIKPYA